MSIIRVIFVRELRGRRLALQIHRTNNPFFPTTTEQKLVGVYTRHVRVQNLVTCNRACLHNLRTTMTWHTGVLHNLLETSADPHKMQITKASIQPAQVACYSITSHIQCIDNSSYMIQHCTVVSFIQLSSVLVRCVCNHLRTMWAIDVIQPTNYLDTTLICIIIHINRARFVCDIIIYWTTNGCFQHENIQKAWDLAAMAISIVFINSF